MAYDAVGRLVSSVETGAFNTTTYTAAYDGDDQMVFESSTTSPGASESSYLVRSSVLGDVLTRLDQSGNKKITYVPAEGLLFATQRASGGPGPYVMSTYRNPLGISETTKAVYDPLGNYIPFVAHGDPRPPAGSYSSASMSGLSSSQANAESYGVGCLMDNAPTTCKSVMDHLEKERGQKLQVIGPASTSFITRLLMTVTAGTEWVPVGPKKLIGGGERSDGKGFKTYISAVELWTYYIVAPSGSQDSSGANQTTPQNPRALTQDEINKVRRDITETLKNPGCAAFVAATLNQVASDTSLPLFSDDVLTNFNEVVKTGTVEATLLSGREAQAWGSAGGGDARIQFNTQYPLTSTFPHVVGIRGIHETTHVSTNKRMYSYSDHDLALASYKVALKLGYKGVPKPPNTLDGIENGSYYADRLFNACNRYGKEQNENILDSSNLLCIAGNL